jgi:hypothetical protein
LHQILAHAIGTVIPGGREQADQVEVEGATRCLLLEVST